MCKNGRNSLCSLVIKNILLTYLDTCLPTYIKVLSKKTEFSLSKNNIPLILLFEIFIWEGRDKE